LKRHPRAILIAGAGLLGILGWLAWRNRTGPDPGAPSLSSLRSSSRPSSPDDTPGVSRTPEGLPRSGGSLGPREKTGRFLQTAQDLRLRAKMAVELALQRGRGPAALQLIREEMSRKPATVEDRLRQAFLARLIAHVADRDPSGLSEALHLSGQILSNRSMDPWARLQVAAGLGGLSSANFGCASLPGGEPLLNFILTPHLAGQPTTEFDASLVKEVRRDPSSCAAILTALTQDPDDEVRVVSAWALSRSGAPGSVQALAAAIRSDEKPAVQAACLGGLAELQAPELPALAKEVVLRERSDISEEAALRVLTRTAPQAPDTAQFLADCLMSGKAPDALPVLAECGLQVQAAAPGRALQEALSNFLLQRAASDPEVVSPFVREAVSRGMTQFLPLFNVLATSLPEGSDAREELALGARQLQNAPYYVELAGRIQESEGEIRRLWTEYSAPGTTPDRGAALRAQIATLTFHLMELQGKLRQ
jgi:hypothetical protein